MNRNQKIHNFLVGFLGWFIVGNLIMWMFFLLLRGTWSEIIRVYGFGVVTIIIAAFLFYKKRNWYALGIVSAIIINAVAWKIYLESPRPLFLFAEVLFVPLPVGLYNLMRLAFGGNV